ncbi:MATE family efflux transporter [Ignavibacterium album]|uniref:MATE family efflux transporter n=1 Tax=Ignavibacterium album TaxID=591197 RepID=UPI0026EA70AD|nr:MATE family efflux transporter [Ignavibacterium album]
MSIIIMIKFFRENKSYIQKTLSLAYPVIIGQLGLIMMGVVDSIMVGELGAVPLAAASLSNSLIFIVLIIAIGNSIAVTPLVAILVGAKKSDECGVYFRQSLLVNLVMGFLVFLIILVGVNYLHLLGQSFSVQQKAKSYMIIIGLSIFPLMIFQTYKQFIEGLSIMRPAMIITLAANLINVFANWVLIFGKLGFPRLELDGAGWATFLSRLFMAISLMIFVMYNKRFRIYDVSFHFRSLNFHVIRRILSVGLPSGFQYFFEVGAFSFAVIMIGWIGANELAAHQIAISLASVSFMGVLGISQAGGILVGNAVGEQSVQLVRKSGFTAIALGMIWMSVSGIIFILFRNHLPFIYIRDEAVIRIASQLLIIAALFQLSDGIQAVGIGILRGLTDVKGPTVITFVAYWIISLPIGYLLAFQFGYGVIGVWIGLLIGLTCSAIMLTLRFNYKSRKLISV